MGTSDELEQMLQALSEPKEYEALDDTMKFIVTRMKRDMDKDKRIPKDLFEAFVRAQAEAGKRGEMPRMLLIFPCLLHILRK